MATEVHRDEPVVAGEDAYLLLPDGMVARPPVDENEGWIPMAMDPIPDRDAIGGANGSHATDRLVGGRRHSDASGEEQAAENEKCYALHKSPNILQAHDG